MLLRFLPTLFCLEAALPLAGSLLISGVCLLAVGCWLHTPGGAAVQAAVQLDTRGGVGVELELFSLCFYPA